MEKKESSGLAIASMILGIVSLLLMCFVDYLPWICAIVSIVLGSTALKKQTPGKGMAIAGIVCSIVSLVAVIILSIVGAALLSAFGEF